MIPLALIALAALLTLAYVARTNARLIDTLDDRHRDERSELATRIQRPEWTPPAKTDFKPPELPKDARALAEVGTVELFREPEDEENLGA
jgi:hypothetical protein